MPLAGSAAYAAAVTLAWNENSDEKVVGFRLHYGTISGAYEYSVDVGNNSSCTIAGLNEGATYFFAATAYNDNDMEYIPE